MIKFGFGGFAAATMAAAFVVGVGAPAAPARAELVPPAPDLSGVVRDKNWAIVLGKALFWDQRVGSDGMACASCHFSGGADSRITNQLSPGLLNIPEDTTFGGIVPGTEGKTASGGDAGPNYTMVPEDFPFHQLEDEADVDSPIIITTNDRMSSAGSFDAAFEGLYRFGPEDVCGEANGDVFHAGGIPGRTVEPRNTPTVVNAAFNHRNFWDGRANNIFNGVDVFGPRDIANDPAKRVMTWDGKNFGLEAMEIENASLASQAVGPPLSNLEMSCSGRKFMVLGRKLLSVGWRPLQFQEIDAYDSVFGSPGPFGDLRDDSGVGLTKFRHYKWLVRKAFKHKYWKGRGKTIITTDGTIVPDDNGFTHMEQNFSMFFGIAVMLYEATLVSDDSKFDRGELNEQEQRGLDFFGGGFGRGEGGRCVACHAPPLFTSAAFQDGDEFTVLQRANFGSGSGEPALHDRGFFNIGLRPTIEDPASGGVDPYGGPLSYARQFLDVIDGSPSLDPINLTGPCDDNLAPGGFGAAGFDECVDGVLTAPIDSSTTRIAVDGALKVPGLRNVALTPPYFHYGGYATLEQVLESYARGGSVRQASLEDAAFTGDNSGSGPFGQSALPVAGDDKGSNLSNNIRVLNCDHDCQADIVAFLKALTDERLQCDKAPFDHPELVVPIGHTETDDDGDGKADDLTYTLPAVGQDGFAEDSGYCVPNEGDLFAPGMRAQAPN